MLPFSELQSLLQPVDPGRSNWIFPTAVPDRFSPPLALALMELSAAAQFHHQPVLVVAQGPDVYVAFSGPSDAAFLLNLRGTANPEPAPLGKGQAYSPFLDSFHARFPDEPAGLAGAQRIWLAGHGLGAADATIAATYLREAGAPIAALYTFGSPRVGDQAFVRSFPVPVFRIVNHLDVIVTMPPAWHYRHLGQHYLITADGQLQYAPGFFTRLPQFASQSAWLGRLLKEGLVSGFPRPLTSLLHQVVGDHSPAAYLARLRHLAS